MDPRMKRAQEINEAAQKYAADAQARLQKLLASTPPVQLQAVMQEEMAKFSANSASLGPLCNDLNAPIPDWLVPYMPQQAQSQQAPVKPAAVAPISTPVAKRTLKPATVQPVPVKAVAKAAVAKNEPEPDLDKMLADLNTQVEAEKGVQKPAAPAKPAAAKLMPKQTPADEAELDSLIAKLNTDGAAPAQTKQTPAAAPAKAPAQVVSKPNPKKPLSPQLIADIKKNDAYRQKMLAQIQEHTGRAFKLEVDFEEWYHATDGENLGTYLHGYLLEAIEMKIEEICRRPDLKALFNSVTKTATIRYQIGTADDDGRRATFPAGVMIIKFQPEMYHTVSNWLCEFLEISIKRAAHPPSARARVLSEQEYDKEILAPTWDNIESILLTLQKYNDKFWNRSHDFSVTVEGLRDMMATPKQLLSIRDLLRDGTTSFAIPEYFEFREFCDSNHLPPLGQRIPTPPPEEEGDDYGGGDDDDYYGGGGGGSSRPSRPEKTVCRTCGGSGRRKCPMCGGKGRVSGKTCNFIGCKGAGTAPCPNC